MTNEYFEKVKNGDIIHFKAIFGLDGIGIFDAFTNDIVRFYCISYKDLKDSVYFISHHSFQKCILNIDAITQFEIASEDEVKELYNKIGKCFTEEYDKDWYNHFTDSSYFDVQDFLLDMFCISIDEYDDDLIYPDFINDIHHYIWDRLCEVTNEDLEHKENKMCYEKPLCNNEEFERTLRDIEHWRYFNHQYSHTEEEKEKIAQMLFDFLREHNCFGGEHFCQDDTVQIDSIDFMCDLADIKDVTDTMEE